ncbi:F-box protein-like isoform X2 [Iris pallida]|uniref:F-box protein-like isoform X2 n=1 Tax=Iris pallida TaxID=29817 RepID=A0AAX6F4B7_IRIPA|nr:F-box protein-like isoform X2 [Iris pallida]KAJ6844263.1 F-box protein-like isoform X2 [Iris pallida]
MIVFLVSFLSFLLFNKPLLPMIFPPWVGELRLLLALLCQEALCHSFQWLKNHVSATAQFLKYLYTTYGSRIENVEVEEEVTASDEMTVLDLPELALEIVLAKLDPPSLCTMASVCASLRDRCRSDRLWERHTEEKWGKVIGKAAQEAWELYMGSRRRPRSRTRLAGPRWWLGPWMRRATRRADAAGDSSGRRLPVESVMARYLALESGRFWFPAQVYNRQNGNAGFMLSCYDAELSYDSRTDTFYARYPPHGQRLASVEEGVKWERLRAAPVATPAHDLHVSDCLSDLRPGDHFEIQWRRNKEFPYGWWYGVVGHLELCDRNELHCRCFSSDTVILEFNQYAPESRWRQTTLSRKNHMEEGNETDGFYGGIRKLRDKDEISMWRQLWPAEILE